jgi:cobalamin biosynthesis Mg chelatase CobN
MPPENEKKNGLIGWVLSQSGLAVKDGTIVDAETKPDSTNTSKDMSKEKETAFNSQDAANYGSAIGNVFTGISSIIASTKGQPPIANTNTVATRANEKAEERNEKNTTENTGYAWYVWVGGLAVAGLVGWGIYAMYNKKS